MGIDKVIDSILVVSLLTLLVGCGDRPERPELEELRALLPGLFEGTEEGFADAVLHIRSRERRRGGATRLEALATVEGRVVGLQLELGAVWVEAELGDGLTLLRGTLTLRSIGDESDRLLRALAVAYGVEPSPGRMRPALTLAATALDGDPRDLDAGPVRIKVFHEPDFDESLASDAEADALYYSLYAEVFLNVDLTARTLEIVEKDPAYRAPLVRALSGEPREGAPR